MKKRKKKDAEQVIFSLLAINTEQFAFFPENFTPNAEQISTINVVFGLNPEEKRISCAVVLQSSQQEKPTLRLSVACFFQISPDSWDNLLHNSSIIIPQVFAGHLSMVTIGAARGVLHVRAAGTLFASTIIPLLNINDLVKEDITFPPISSQTED